MSERYLSSFGGSQAPTERELERRTASSTIVHEEFLGPQRRSTEEVRYVEVPVIEHVVKHVPRREVVEIERKVPRYEYEWIEKTIEIPEIQWVDKTVQVSQIQEVVRTIPKREVVEVPKETIRYVPKIETVTVEKIVEVPGQVVEIPKPFTVENKVAVAKYIDREVPMIVAQSVKPIIYASEDVVEVDLVEYEPEIVMVDIQVPKVIPSHIIAVGATQEEHKLVTVPPAQYNAMLRLLNPHIDESDPSSLPYIKENGSVPMLSAQDRHLGYPAPLPGAEIRGWTPTTVQIATRELEEQRLASQGQQWEVQSEVEHHHEKRFQSHTSTGRSRRSQPRQPKAPRYVCCA